MVAPCTGILPDPSYCVIGTNMPFLVLENYITVLWIGNRSRPTPGRAES